MTNCELLDFDGLLQRPSCPVRHASEKTRVHGGTRVASWLEAIIKRRSNSVRWNYITGQTQRVQKTDLQVNVGIRSYRTSPT